MEVSSKTRYGLKAMFYLAKKNRICSAKEISQREKIPFDFLEKILFELKEKGLIKSQKGKGGGYSLAKPSEEINIKEILEVLEEKDIFIIHCHKKRHLSRKQCPIKKIWKTIQNILNSSLEKISLASLCQRK